MNPNFPYPADLRDKGFAPLAEATVYGAHDKPTMTKQKLIADWAIHGQATSRRKGRDEIWHITKNRPAKCSALAHWMLQTIFYRYHDSAKLTWDPHEHISYFQAMFTSDDAHLRQLRTWQTDSTGLTQELELARTEEQEEPTSSVFPLVDGVVA